MKNRKEKLVFEYIMKFTSKYGDLTSVSKSDLELIKNEHIFPEIQLLLNGLADRDAIDDGK